MGWKPNQVFLPDLSHYEWPVDMRALADSGCVGVIWKATQGRGNQDSTYTQARAAAYASGMLWGAYHFGDSSDVDGQVNNFLSYATPTDDDLIALDYEDNGSVTMTLAQAKDWITKVETQQNRPGQCVVYSGNLLKEGLKTTDSWWNARRLWLAQYTNSIPTLPKGFKAYWIWQFTDGSNGPSPHSVAGVSGTCDVNAYDGTAQELATQWSGAGGAPAPPPPSELAVDITITAPPGVTVNVHNQTTSP